AVGLGPPRSSAPEPLGAAAASCTGAPSYPMLRSTCRKARGGRAPTAFFVVRLGGAGRLVACLVEEEHATPVSSAPRAAKPSTESRAAGTLTCRMPDGF